MGRLGTASAAIGAVVGLFCVVEYSLSCHGVTPLGSACSAEPIAPPGNDGIAFALLAVILVLASLGTYVGPRALFYISALVGAFIDLVEALNYSSIDTEWLGATALVVTVSVILSILAARQRSGVSEQANPMNLPVFG